MLSAPELLIRSLGVLAIFGCSSVLIFWVELWLTVTLPCLALKIVTSFLAYSSPRPPLNTTTLTVLPSLTPNGLSADLVPPLVSLPLLPPLAHAESSPPAGVATTPATAARFRTVRRDRADGVFSGVPDMLNLL